MAYLSREDYKEIAKLLDVVFNGDNHGDDRRIGFTLLVYKMHPDATMEGNQCNYISNVDSALMIESIKSWLKYAEDRAAKIAAGVEFDDFKSDRRTTNRRTS